MYIVNSQACTSLHNPGLSHPALNSTTSALACIRHEEYDAAFLGIAASQCLVNSAGVSSSDRLGDVQNRGLNLALEREKQKCAGLGAELQKARTVGNVPLPGTSDPQVGLCNIV